MRRISREQFRGSVGVKVACADVDTEVPGEEEGCGGGPDRLESTDTRNSDEEGKEGSWKSWKK